MYAVSLIVTETLESTLAELVQLMLGMGAPEATQTSTSKLVSLMAVSAGGVRIFAGAVEF